MLCCVTVQPSHSHFLGWGAGPDPGFQLTVRCRYNPVPGPGLPVPGRTVEFLADGTTTFVRLMHHTVLVMLLLLLSRFQHFLQ